MSYRFAFFAASAYVVAFLVGAAILVSAASAFPVHATVPAVHVPAIPTVHVACGAEDGATWTWSRCGNRRRGVRDLRTGRVVIVGPCAFRRLWMHGDAGIDGKAGTVDGPMRGDWWAIVHGCAPSHSAA
jgi:hypothetical protein